MADPLINSDLKIAMVEWLDINSHIAPWTDLPTDLRPARCLTVGILIDEGDDYVSVATSYSETAESKGALAMCAIPRGCITRLEVLSWNKLREQFEA